MSWTKGELVRDALSEMGLASYEFDISPEETVSAVRRLDSMLAQWESDGIRMGYHQPSSADGSSVEDVSNIPDFAHEAIITNLAIRLAPSYGKVISPDTRMTAKFTYSRLAGRFAKAPEQQKLSMPKGAGYKTTDSRWTNPPSDILSAGDDSYLDLEGVLNVDTD